MARTGGTKLGGPGRSRRTSGGRGPKRWFFDVWSWVYDAAWVQRAIYRPEQDAVVEALREERVRTVLDVGCGTGQLAHRIRTEVHGVRVVGADFSPGMLHQARVRDARVAWVQSDAGRLPFRDEAFDAVVSTEAFHWFPDQHAALRELGRVLRPEGRVLLTVVAPPLALVSRVASAGSRLLGQPFRLTSGRELRRAATAAGFHVERTRRLFRLPGAFLLPPLLLVGRRSTAPAPHRRASGG